MNKFSTNYLLIQINKINETIKKEIYLYNKVWNYNKIKSNKNLMIYTIKTELINYLINNNNQNLKISKTYLMIKWLIKKIKATNNLSKNNICINKIKWKIQIKIKTIENSV